MEGSDSAARRAVDRLDDPFLALDDALRVTYLNSAAGAVLGVDVGESLPDALPVDAADRLRRRCTESVETGDPRTFDLDLDSRYVVRSVPDGDELTLSFRAAAPDEAAAELALKDRAINEAPVGITIADADREDEPLMFVNDAFEELTGYSTDEVLGRNCRFLQGEGTDPEAVAELRRAIDAEEPTSVELQNYRKGGERFWNRVDVAPLRDDEGGVTHYVGFQLDVTERRRAERAARRRAAELEHVLARIEGLLSDVTTAVVGAETRSDVERVVCEELVAVDPYTAAWVGERQLGTDEVTVREHAGFETPDDGAGAVPDPAVEADVVTDALDSGGLRVSGDGQTAAVALATADAEYGVLVVRSVTPDAFDERERVVLESLARAIASAIHARETRRVLVDDQVVEAEFVFESPALSFLDVARSTGAELSYEGTVHRDDGPVVVLYTSRGAAPEAVVEAATGHEDVAAASVVAEHDESALVEIVPGSRSVVEAMTEYGGQTRSITVDPEECRMVVEFPQDADLRALLERLRERYPGTRLRSIRNRERPARTQEEFLAALSEKLTDRQRAVFQKAYVGGFFDWPRPVTGEALAESMGISRSTFHEHLRAAERKLAAEFFGGRDD